MTSKLAPVSLQYAPQSGSFPADALVWKQLASQSFFKAPLQPQARSLNYPFVHVTADLRRRESSKEGQC